MIIKSLIIGNLNLISTTFFVEKFGCQILNPQILFQSSKYSYFCPSVGISCKFNFFNLLCVLCVNFKVLCVNLYLISLS